MTARTPADRERRRNLADASITPLPALSGVLRRVPAQRHRSRGLVSSLNASNPANNGDARNGTER